MARVILIHYPDRYESEEARALAKAGWYEVIGSLTQRFLARAKYGVGEGKAEEASELVRETNAEKVIFDSQLTHFLVEAFKSTLEEVSLATVVLLLVDASLPAERMALNCGSCFETLSELDVSDSRVMTVMNKSDLVTQEELGEKMWQAGIRDATFISARTGQGIARLFHEVSLRIEGPQRTLLEGAP